MGFADLPVFIQRLFWFSALILVWLLIIAATLNLIEEIVGP